MAKPLADHGWVLSDQDSTMRTYRLREDPNTYLQYNKKYFAVYKNPLRADTIQPIRNLPKVIGDMAISITN